MPDNWERLLAVMELEARMTPNYFAHYIGLPCGENLYRIKRGLNGISKDVAERIVAKFPRISKGWLLTGEGNMYLDRNVRSVTIPFYDGNLENALSGRCTVPAYELSLPQMKGKCDLAVRYNINPLDDTTDNIYLLKAIEPEQLAGGKEYFFLIDNLLSVWAWRPERPVSFKADDRIYAIKGIMKIFDEQQ